jgi:HPt (histidine-containing phosphotransfer) domain-containing protein
VTGPEPIQEITASPSAALDRQVLEGLREALGDVSGEFITGLVVVYETQAGELMAELVDAAEDADAKRLSSAAHSLKGSSAEVGGHRLAGLCAKLEHWDGSPDDLPPVVATIRTELAALLVELREFVAR